MKDSSFKMSVSADEWRARVELAACYRLVAMYGWSDLIATHISMKLPSNDNTKKHQFLINPYGLMFDEITASSLIKIDVEGNKLDDTPYEVNRAGFTIHSAIHKGRDDVTCILHTHTRAGVAVSAQKCGLLPISQQSTLVLGSLGYHDYEGIAVREDEQSRLQNDLGRNDHFILRNHGLLTVGSNVADTFKRMYTLESACQIQISAQAGGELIMVANEVQASVDEALEKMKVHGKNLAGLAWPALLRRLDRLNPGYDS